MSKIFWFMTQQAYGSSIDPIFPPSASKTITSGRMQHSDGMPKLLWICSTQHPQRKAWSWRRKGTETTHKRKAARTQAEGDENTTVHYVCHLHDDVAVGVVALVDHQLAVPGILAAYPLHAVGVLFDVLLGTVVAIFRHRTGSGTRKERQWKRKEGQ